MAVKKVTRKVISKAPVKEIEVSEQTGETEKTGLPQEAGRPKKVCFFCQGKTNPSYTDINTLRRLMTDRAKIVPKSKSNLCSKHQRFVTKQIKYARHLALLPFTPKV